ncbi:MAG: hypothetical protein FH751_09910 [Firmicutes bacterium]|nr:hypothetical protein [Bacillota bacterium]
MGKQCECGNECFVLQNQFHPWDESSFSVKIKCPECDDIVKIEKIDTEKYYNQKIYNYFNNMSGEIIDLGCG